MELVLGIAASLTASAMILFVTVAWRHRAHLRILPLWASGSAPVRVSLAALLRVQDDDSYVLFHTPYTPGSFGPPGGVFKYDSNGQPVLDRLDFREQRPTGRASVMRADLRGFIPAKSAPAFMKWFRTGAGRESSRECLLRELTEELREIGHPELIALTANLTFSHVRTVIEPPRRVPARDYRQLRYFEVWDLVVSDTSSLRLRNELLRLARNRKESYVALVSGQDIVNGRRGDALVGPQSAFLIGRRRIRPDLPPLP